MYVLWNIWVWKKKFILKRRTGEVTKIGLKSFIVVLDTSPLAANTVLMLGQVKERKNLLPGRAADHSASKSNTRSSGIPVSEL